MIVKLKVAEIDPTLDDSAPAPSKWWRLAKTVLAVAGIAMVLFFWWWCSDAERRAIRDLPSGERQALLSRTLENLKSVCQTPEDAMREFCETQASLALKIPECDGACQALVREQIARVRVPR